MDISIAFFNKSCPAAVTPDGGIFESVSAFFDHPSCELTSFVGEELWAKLEALDYDPTDTPSTAMETLRQAVSGFICVTAFLDAVPQLDLVLTSTGFGVVSNDNVAPASADRVRSLKESLALRQGALFDQIVTVLQGMEEWNNSCSAVWFCAVLFLTCHEIASMTGKPATLTERDLALPEIYQCQCELYRIISPELIQRLLDGVRTGSLTRQETYLRNLIRQYTALWLRGRSGNPLLNQPFFVDDSQKSILKYVEDNLEAFPAYAKSATYKAHHFQRYENKKEDTSFFFC